MPAEARGDWIVSAYVGGAFTYPSAVHVMSSHTGSHMFENVTFRSESLRSPIYYGYRVGRRLKQPAVFVEAELIHLKVIADADALGDGVQHLAMSHGMNFILANVVWITPAGPRVRKLDLIARVGVGPTVPHAESRVGGEERQGYELGGLGLQVAPGLALRVTDRLRVTADYKFTFARPQIDVAGGTATTTLRTHHIAVGFSAVL